MKSIKFLIVFAFILISVISTRAQKITIPDITSVNQTSFFLAKYEKYKVWDVQRRPAYPIAGQDWTLSGTKDALDANGAKIDWGKGRYLMLESIYDEAKTTHSLNYDFDKNGIKYNIALKLYESNGTLVKVLSKWGILLGKGDKGFVYEAEGKYGLFFSVTNLTASAVVKYKPSLSKVTKFSEIISSSEMPKFTTNPMNIPDSTSVNQTSFFLVKYEKNKVWDVQRRPAYPIAGQDWNLSGTKDALDANGAKIDWGKGRYLMLEAIYDEAKSTHSLNYDFDKNGIKYNIALKLYESNGTLVKVLSKWGILLGKGDKGFVYEAEGKYGLFFSVTNLTASAVVKYKPSLSKVTKFSEITSSSEMPNKNLDGRQIIEKVNNRDEGSDQYSRMVMVLVDMQGRKQIRNGEQMKKISKDGVKTAIKFLQPADVKDASFLSLSYNSNKSDDQWLYLPALRKTMPISSVDKSKSFMGTDYTYGDLGSRKLDEDTHKLLREENLNSKLCYVVESVSINKDYMYSKTITWIDKSKLINVKKEFYDKEGKLLKTLETLETKEIAGYLIITKYEMINVQEKHKTLIQLEGIKINDGLSDEIFTSKSMMR